MTEKWLADGTKVEVVSESPLIVTEIVQVEDYEGYCEVEGRTFQADKVYNTPPVRVQHEMVQRLTKQIEKLNQERLAISAELASIKRERDEHIKKLAKVDETLQTLDDVLGGNITHFVCSKWHSYDIIATGELAEKMSERYDDNEGQYIMSLYLKKTYSGLEWHLTGDYKARWSSYMDKNCLVPCSSQGQAVELLAAKVNKDIAEEYLGQSAIDAAKKYGFGIPDDYEDRLVARDVKNLRQQITKHENDIATIEQNIKSLLEKADED